MSKDDAINITKSSNLKKVEKCVKKLIIKEIEMRY